VNPSRRASRGLLRSPSYRLDFLRELPPATAEVLRRHGVKRRHASGVTLVQRGQSMTSVVVLLRGRLRTVTSLPDGREHLLRWIEPGEVVGIASVLSDLPLQVDLISSGSGEVLLIPGGVFIAALRNNAAAALAVARLLATRYSELFDHVAAQAQARLQDRVVAALAHLAVENGEPLPDGRLRLRVTQQDVSDAVGASRQRVNEALRGLQRDGLVEIGYRQITIASS
jgi:CRP/FNR family transcriptional regulator, cyclic AMP receptor protein